MHRSICVFCGSSPGANPAYSEAARDLGAILAAEGQRLVYGGGNVGLMGVVADAVLPAGGTVVGVIPQHLLDLEVGHRGVTELRVVPAMHERKEQMSTLADAFVLLPGGLGSLEEFLEISARAHARRTDAPVVIWDLRGSHSTNSSRGIASPIFRLRRATDARAAPQCAPRSEGRDRPAPARRGRAAMSTSEAEPLFQSTEPERRARVALDGAPHVARRRLP